MEVVFESLRELYKRVTPALETKRVEMKRAGYPYIKCEDIWNYLKEIKWKNAKNLELSEMVSDILNSDPIYIDEHLKRNLKFQERYAYFDED